MAKSEALRTRMALWLFRGLFILAAAAAGYSIGQDVEKPLFALLIGIGGGLVLVIAEWLISRSSIAVISSIVFGMLVGMLLALFASKLLVLLAGPFDSTHVESNILLGLLVAFIYLSMSFIYQTRDRFKILIPYIEFRKSERGARPVILDTNVIIDGRAAEFLQTGVIDGPIVVAQPVLQELHQIADSKDRIKRERGRLGLDVLHELRTAPSLDIHIEETAPESGEPVDEQLVKLAQSIGARIMTNDFNLNRLATVAGVEVINLNELANALKPIALPDETIATKLLKRGEQAGQAVGYLDDGTMVVVENAAHLLGEEVQVLVTNTITRDTGRMIFGKLGRRQSQNTQSHR